jgi:PadR family transcriptional regulator, regulatory protein PadR
MSDGFPKTASCPCRGPKRSVCRINKSRIPEGIARSIRQQSEDVFLVDHGSLYLALQRLEEKGWVRAEWGVSENNRRARYYSLSATGRKQLTQQASRWRSVAKAISLIIGPGEAEV